MADADLQALLDPDGQTTGLKITRRYDVSTYTEYYVVGNALGHGQSKWVRVTTADSDADKDTAIRAAFGI